MFCCGRGLTVSDMTIDAASPKRPGRPPVRTAGARRRVLGSLAPVLTVLAVVAVMVAIRLSSPIGLTTGGDPVVRYGPPSSEELLSRQAPGRGETAATEATPLSSPPGELALMTAQGQR
jgi:hypothetical protein